MSELPKLPDKLPTKLSDDVKAKFFSNLLNKKIKDIVEESEEGDRKGNSKK